MSLLPTISSVVPNNWNSVVTFNHDVQRCVQKLSSILLGPTATPTFASLTLTGNLTIAGSLTLSGLTASKLVGTDANKALQSISVGNSITLTGTTLNTIQDIRITATPTFASLTLNGTAIYGLDTSGGIWTNGDINLASPGIIRSGGLGFIRVNNTNYNIFCGTSSFNNDAGQYNVGVGYQTGYNNDTTGAGNQGDKNIYVGYMSGYGATVATKNTGYYNVGVGYQTLYKNTSGYGNIALGWTALYSNTSGYGNIAIGLSSLYFNTTGNSNTAIGINALGYNVIGLRNTAVGDSALYRNTGNDNTAFGSRALYSNVSGIQNTAFGASSLQSNTTGNNNIAFGFYSLVLNTEGTENTAIGMYSLYSNTTGINNTGMGFQALKYNETGGYNASLGRNSLYANKTGNYNSAIGFGSGFFNTEGDYNASVGYYSLTCSIGNGNTGLGASADYFTPAVTLVQTSVAGAGLEIGVYRYRASFVLDGAETALCDITGYATTTAGNQQVNLSVIPTYTGPRTCTARKLYRTKVNGTQYYYYLDAIPNNTTTTYSDTIPDASLTTIPTELNYSIMLGYQAKAFLSNEMVIGADDYYISNLYLGEGVYATSPHDVTINATGGSGTNNAGASLILAGGKGTGTGTGGSIILQTATAGSSGSLANSLTTRLTIDSNGRVGILTIAPNEVLDVVGNIRCSGVFNVAGAAGVTQAASTGKVSDVTALAGGIATAQTQITYITDGDHTVGTNTITTANGRITVIV